MRPSGNRVSRAWSRAGSGCCRTPDDDIEPGDVLVASVTDVGHTAMFGYAAAVVPTSAAPPPTLPSSPASSASRAWWTPSTPPAALQDGQLVRVYGATGTVTLLAEAGASAAADAEVALR